MFNVLPYEEIYKGIRYDTTEGSTLLGYTEALEDGPGMQDKLLWKGLNGRYWLSIQKSKKYKYGDDSVKVLPLSKEEAIGIFNDMAEKKVPEAVFDDVIIA